MFVYDVLVGLKLEYILVCYEQVVSFVVDVQVCLIGKVGVCLVIFGFGVINLLIGIVNVYMDSVFMVILIGQVFLILMGIDVFQEVDVFGMSLLVVKYFMIVCYVEDILVIICEVFEIVEEG